MVTATQVTAPFQQFPDIDGDPLEAGYIYIGTAGLDPVSNPLTGSVFWDAANTIPAALPVRTVAGFPSRSGAPGKIFLAAGTQYSVLIRNKNGTTLYSSLNEYGSIYDLIAYIASVISVPSVAAMKTRDLEPGSAVSTRSYYGTWLSSSTAAFGGATYQIVTPADFLTLTGNATPDEYGDHTLDNGNIAMLLLNDTLLASQFGTKPNDLTFDNHGPIQAWADRFTECGLINGKLEAGLYKVSDTVSFTRTYYFKLDFDGSSITPDVTAVWSQKPVFDIVSCYSGRIVGLNVQSNLTDSAAWQTKAATITDLPVCMVMMRRTPTGAGYIVKNTDEAGGDSCQLVQLDNFYIKGWCQFAACVTTRAETNKFESGLMGGLSCPALLNTGTPSQVFQSDAVGNSNRDHVYSNVQFEQEFYSVLTDTHSCVELIDVVLDARFRDCYFALGGMQSSSAAAPVAAFKLGQTTGQGGFTNITIEDCYGENAGDNFVVMDMQSFDTHDIRIDGWRHSQENGNTIAIMYYRGNTAANDANFYLDRIFPPTNSTDVSLIYATKDINGAYVHNCKGILTATGGSFIYNAEVELRQEDIAASAPIGLQEIDALLPGAYTLKTKAYPSNTMYTRNRPSTSGETTLAATSSPQALFSFDRASSNVFTVTAVATVSDVIEGPSTFRATQDTATVWDIVGEGEIVYLNFTIDTTLKHNFTANSAFSFNLKTAADTLYLAGRVVGFVRVGTQLVEI